MSEIAVVIIDPGDKRSAQLVDDEQHIGDLIRLLLERLDLPQDLNYRLIPLAHGKALKDRQTLSRAGVSPGDELQLSLLRDGLFRKLRDQLYKKAAEYVRDKLWEKAIAELEQLFRLDPNHPDPQDLRTAVKTRQVPKELRDPSFKPKHGQGPDPRRTADPRPAPPEITKPPGVEVPAGESPAGPASARGAPGARSGPRWGCVIVAVVVVLGGIIGVGGIGVLAWLSNQGDMDLPFPQSGGEQDPVLGTGAVQVTLHWAGPADLDLHVVDPLGETIWFDNLQSQSGGVLDVDANADCAERMTNPVENIYWPIGMAPAGEYQVHVVYFRECDTSGPTAYEITVKQDGELFNRYEGTVVPGDEVYIDSFLR